MSKKKTAGIITVCAIIALGTVLVFFAAEHDLFASGNYYTKVNNERVTTNDSDTGVIHLESSEPYVYSLPAVDAQGTKIQVEFGASRQLRNDAYLELHMEPFRGVVFWEEIDRSQLPAAAAEQIG